MPNQSIIRFSYWASAGALALLVGCSTHNNQLQMVEKPPVINKHSYSIRPNNFERYARPRDALESSSNSIWNRLTSLYRLPEIDNERIDQHVAWFLDHPGYLERVQKRAEPYLHLILEEIEAKNVPGEIALLPVVESAFQPNVESPAKASGLWQFIPATGRLYGLKQNRWYDGRQDVYASTRAATQYLKDLSEEFNGDWLLALASYNWGKGNVKKSINRNQSNDLPTDYWSLSMPEETANYVPRLLAVAKIFANPDRYNLELQDIPNQPYFEVVRLDAHLDFNKAAQLAETSVEEIIRLNPGFKKWRTAPNSPNRLLIPIDRVDIFKENLAQLSPEDFLPPPSRSQPKKAQSKIGSHYRYWVKKGDTLSRIARQHKTSTAQVLELNPGISKNQIQSGQMLRLPGVKGRPRPAPSKTYYTVKAGDSLTQVAKKFGTDVKTLSKLNGLNNKHIIKTGQKIKVSGKASTAKHVRYVVRRGDSLSSISRRFNVSVNDLKRWNTKTNALQPGQALTVMVNDAT